MREFAVPAFLLLTAVFAGAPENCFAEERGSAAAILSSDIKPYRQALEGFNNSLAEKNAGIRVSQYNLAAQGAKYVLEQVRSKKTDVIFAVGTDAAILVKDNIKDIPAVFAVVLKPETIMGSNVTGVSMDVPAAMKIGKIREIFPGLKKAGVIYSPESVSIYKEMSLACDDAGIQLLAVKINQEKDFSEAFKSISWKIELLVMIPDTRLYRKKELIEYLLQDCLADKLPVIGLSSYYTKGGALISFDCDYEDMGRQAGETAKSMMDGEKPENIQIAKPRKIKYSLNLAIAENLNLQMSPDIIDGASEVFK